MHEIPSNSNSGPKNPRPDVGELIAYLDGELAPAERQAIEARLGHDAELREQLRGLQRAWDCLDELPKTSVGDKFTQTTVAMVAVAASDEVAALVSGQAARRAKRGILCAGGLAVAALLGCFFASFFWPNPDRTLLRDLQVLGRIDLLEVADSAEFVGELTRRQIFGDESAAGGNPQIFATALEAEPQDREKRIEELSAAEKRQLSHRQRRWEGLAAGERRRLAELERQIAGDGQSAALWETLARYQAWLQDLTPGKRADLVALPREERIAAIKRMREEEQRSEFGGGRFGPGDIRPLTPADVEMLVTWATQQLRREVESHGDRLESMMPPLVRDRINRMPTEQRENILMIVAGRRLFAGDRGPAPWMAGKDLEELVGRLSNPAREALTAESSDAGRQELLAGWIRKSFAQRMRSLFLGSSSNQVSQEELERFFVEDLESDQRAELLNLTSEQMQARLRQLYFFGQSWPPAPFGGPGRYRHAPGGFSRERPGERPGDRPGEFEPRSGDEPPLRPGHNRGPRGPRNF